MSVPTPPSDHWTWRLPKKRIAAGALFFDHVDRVLLVEPTYTAGWDLPGGVVEANETPYAAACREVEEELGLTKPLGAMLVVDWEPPTESIPLEGFTVTFDGGVLSDAEIASIRVQREELHRFEFCTRDEAVERLPAYLCRRLDAALGARATGTAVYLDDGYAPR